MLHQWHLSLMPLLPKLKHLHNGKLLTLSQYHFRPISLTATLSKVLESFNAEWICQKLDPKQVGAIPCSSPVDALISLLHSLYANSDGNIKTVRLFLLDFSNPFDRINYKMSITKMRKLDINPSVINWKETAS